MMRAVCVAYSEMLAQGTSIARPADGRGNYRCVARAERDADDPSGARPRCRPPGKAGTQLRPHASCPPADFVSMIDKRVAVEDVVRIARMITAGEIDHDEAHELLELLSWHNE